MAYNSAGWYLSKGEYDELLYKTLLSIPDIKRYLDSIAATNKNRLIVECAERAYKEGAIDRDEYVNVIDQIITVLGVHD